jgi:hypothetical protein
MEKARCKTCDTKLPKRRSCAAQGYARDADGAPLDVVSNDCQRCGAECCLECIDKILFFGVICDTRGCDALGCNFCMHFHKIPGGEGKCGAHAPKTARKRAARKRPTKPFVAPPKAAKRTRK